MNASLIKRIGSGLEKLMELTKPYSDRYQLNCREVLKEKRRIKKLSRELTAIEEAILVVNDTAEQLQTKVHNQISYVVSKSLKTIFPDPYEFRIEFRKKRNKTEAVLVLERDGLVLEDPLEEIGLGVVDVAVFALRVACVLISVPPKRRFIALDEPFRHLHSSLHDRAGQLLNEIAHELDFQFLVVTQSDYLRSGKVIHLD